MQNFAEPMEVCKRASNAKRKIHEKKKIWGSHGIIICLEHGYGIHTAAEERNTKTSRPWRRDCDAKGLELAHELLQLH